MSELQLGSWAGNVGTAGAYSPLENQPDASQPQTLPLKDLLAGNSVVLTPSHVDIYSLVEHLKVATQQNKEVVQQTVMSSAISAVVGRIAATNDEQAQLLTELGVKTDDYLKLSKEAERLANACTSDGQHIKTLEMKVKELEEAVERMRKTPEEKKEEIEKKERELEQAQGALDAARNTEAKDKADYQQVLNAMGNLEQEIKDVRDQLDNRSVNILSQALVELFFSYEAENAQDEELRVPDGMVNFLKLLGGENLVDKVQDMLDDIQTNKQEPV